MINIKIDRFNKKDVINIKRRSLKVIRRKKGREKIKIKSYTFLLILRETKYICKNNELTLTYDTVPFTYPSLSRSSDSYTGQKKREDEKVAENLAENKAIASTSTYVCALTLVIYT